MILESPRSADDGLGGDGPGREEPTSRVAALKSATYREQVLSKEFLLCTAFTALQLLHINLYIGTVDDQMAMLMDGGGAHTNSSEARAAGRQSIRLVLVVS